MIYLLTGMPGNGKTLYAVDFIVKAVGKGRDVYSDIKGLTVEGVQPAPEDWRTAPDGALIVYDEAHKRFPAFKGKGRSPLEVVRDMDEHRHRGIDMLMITQWPDKVDGELFRLVGTHMHLNRAMGLQRANLTTFSRAMFNPYSATARKGADETIWEFPTHLYKSYKSSSLHTDAHKFKLPAKIKNALISAPLVLLALWGAYHFAFRQNVPQSEERNGVEPTNVAAGVTYSSLGASTLPAMSQATPGMGAYMAIYTQPAPTLAGCVATAERCRCFNAEGYQIDFSEQECRRTLAGPMPYNVYHDYRAPQGAAPAVAEATGDRGGASLAGTVVQGSMTEVVGKGPGAGIMPGS